MLNEKVIASLLTLHENSAGPLQRVYEICLEEMSNLDDEINSVADLPRIPFTKAIKRNIEAAITPVATSMEPETEVESNLQQISNNKRKRLTKRRKKHASETESSTSLNHLRKKRGPKRQPEISYHHPLPLCRHYQTQVDREWCAHSVKYGLNSTKCDSMNANTTNVQAPPWRDQLDQWDKPRKMLIRCQNLNITEHNSLFFNKQTSIN